MHAFPLAAARTEVVTSASGRARRARPRGDAPSPLRPPRHQPAPRHTSPARAPPTPGPPRRHRHRRRVAIQRIAIAAATAAPHADPLAQFGPVHGTFADVVHRVAALAGIAVDSCHRRRRTRPNCRIGSDPCHASPRPRWDAALRLHSSRRTRHDTGRRLRNPAPARSRAPARALRIPAPRPARCAGTRRKSRCRKCRRDPALRPSRRAPGSPPPRVRCRPVPTSKYTISRSVLPPPAGTSPGNAWDNAPTTRSWIRIAVVKRMPQAAGKRALTTDASGSTRSMQRWMPALMWIASDFVTTKLVRPSDRNGWCCIAPVGRFSAARTCGSEPV